MTSCFFCQNLLSDYLEEVLPSVREEEIRGHLDKCTSCQKSHRDLKETLNLLGNLPPTPLDPELSLQMGEVSHGKRLRHRVAQPRSWSSAAAMAIVPLLLIGAVIWGFPQLFPWLPLRSPASSEAHFARFHPLLQGAETIIEEQASFLQMRDAFMGSLWEEGGLSPEEFERAFQVKALPTDSPDGSNGAP